MDLEKQRKKIDSIDGKMLSLLSQRANIAKEVSKEKSKNGQAVYAPERERALLEKLIKDNKGPLSAKAIDSIYRNIVSECRALEAKLKITYLGPAATFTHMAALKNFGSNCTFIPENSISDIFNEVEKGTVDYGVVPIENSTDGTINHTLDMFLESDLNIVAEVMLDISHNLLSKHSLKEIKKVYSRPSALAQCRKWLATNLPNAELIDCSSTAKAAEIASNCKDCAAVASELAAKEYDLKVAAKNIQDSSHNITRFLAIGKSTPKKSNKTKTSIMFSVKHKPGALFDALKAFADNKVNMTKIESRPTKRKAWEVVFFIDFEGYIEDSNTKKTIEQMKKSCLFVKILGSYPEEVSVSE